MSDSKDHRAQFERYLKSEMSQKEAHAFERESLDDAFAEEALEGFSESGIHHLKDLETLELEVNERNRKKNSWWRYAGVAAILLIGSYFTFLMVDRLGVDAPIASSETKPESQALVPADSVTKIEAIPERLDADSVSASAPLPVVASEETGMDSPDDTQIAEAKVMEPEKMGQPQEVSEDYLAFSEVSDEDTDDQVGLDEKAGISASELASKQVLEVASLPADLQPEADFSESEIKEDEISEFQDQTLGARASRKLSKKKVTRTEAVQRSAFYKADGLISGRVTDEFGDGLPGVSIRIKGTSSGTVSDLDG